MHVGSSKGKGYSVHRFLALNLCKTNGVCSAERIFHLLTRDYKMKAVYRVKADQPKDEFHYQRSPLRLWVWVFLRPA